MKHLKKTLITTFFIAFSFALFGQTQSNTLTDKEKEALISKRVEYFIKDYFLHLNHLGNINISDKQINARDFFVSEDSKVINDLFPQILRNYFSPEEYSKLVAKWFQQGITFEMKQFTIKKIKQDTDSYFINCSVKRKISVGSKKPFDNLSLNFHILISKDEIDAKSIPKIVEITKI